MRRLQPHLPLALSLLLTAALGGVALAEQSLRLDPETTRVTFSLGATLHSVEGTVRVVGGEIRFQETGGPAEGEIVVDATSAETGNDGRDKDMHKKVLESTRFGSFVLRVTETVGTLSPSGTSTLELHGELDIHGDSHPVVLEAVTERDGESLTGTATFQVPYVEWGMKDPSKLFLRVAKFVEVKIALSGRLSDIAAGR